MNKEKLEGTKNIFLIALAIDITVSALVVTSDFWEVGVLRDIAAGEITANQSTFSTIEFWDSFTKLMLLTTLGVGLGLVKWLNACYRYAKEAIGASGFKNEGWTVGSWIIPIYNMFKPYRVVNEIYKAGSQNYTVPDGWQRENGSGLLLTWWIFWAVTHFIGWIVGKQMLKHSTGQTDINLQDSIIAIEFHALFCVMFLAVSALWIVVANTLTRRLLDRQHSFIGMSSYEESSKSGFGSARIDTGIGQGSSDNVKPEVSKSAAQQHDREIKPAYIMMAKPTVTPYPPAGAPQQPDASPLNPEAEEDFWATAMNELETGQRRTGVWAKAFAESDGDEIKAKVVYLRSRVQQLKMSDFEMRRQADANKAEQKKMMEEKIISETIIHIDTSSPRKCIATLGALGYKVSHKGGESWEVTGPSGITALAYSIENLISLTKTYANRSAKKFTP